MISHEQNEKRDMCREKKVSSFSCEVSGDASDMDGRNQLMDNRLFLFLTMYCICMKIDAEENKSNTQNTFSNVLYLIQIGRLRLDIPFGAAESVVSSTRRVAAFQSMKLRTAR